MEQIGAGRASTVFALDQRRVLRRSAGDVSAEARVMRHVRAAGFPVPAVLAAAGGELVMERLHGPTLAAGLIGGRVAPAAAAAVLLDLHERLHRLDPPPWLAAAPRGLTTDAVPGPARLLHLDLHPENVMLTATGPQVIDWSNAAAGPAACDAAVTWAIMAGVDLGALGLDAEAAAAVRHGMLPALRTAGAAALAWAAAYRNADPGTGPAEAAALRAALAEAP